MTPQELTQLPTFKSKLAYLNSVTAKAVEIGLDVSTTNVQVNTALKRQLLLKIQSLVQAMMQDVTTANQAASSAQANQTELKLDL